MEKLVVDNLRTHFETARGTVRAVDGVSFALGAGEVMGLVGESGSGKSMTGFSLLGLVDPPGRIVGGRVLLDGEDLLQAPPERLRALRGGRIAMIFQDPQATLNPVLRIDTQMIETIRAHDPSATEAAARERSIEALRRVGMAAPEARMAAYPHSLSGGMRQRVAIAIAMLNRPEVIIADEPTTALDVTIQAQILHEMQRLCRESGTALLWITHDLAVVAGLADKVCVMYAGRIVEEGPVDAVIDAPLHPYTLGLLASLPERNVRGAPLAQIGGGVPRAGALPEGCTFRDRCPRAADKCRETPPAFAHGPARRVRCFFPHAE